MLNIGECGHLVCTSCVRAAGRYRYRLHVHEWLDSVASRLPTLSVAAGCGHVYLLA